MKLSIREIQALNGSLEGLFKGGNPQVIRRNSQDEIAVVPFKLSADIYQWAMTLQGRLTELLHTYNGAMTALMREKSGGTGHIDNGTKAMLEFQEESVKLLDGFKYVRMLTLPLENLKIDDNPGLAQHLAGLMPALKLPALNVAAEEKDEQAQPAAKAKSAAA